MGKMIMGWFFKIPKDWDDAAYLARNSDVATAVGLGQFLHGYAHFKRYGKREGRAPAWLSVAAADTRLCMDPWNYLEIDPNLGVKPCCNIGVLEHWQPAHTTDVDQLRNGAPFRELRQQLLTGQLGEACSRCHIRQRVPKADLVAAIRRRYGKDVLAPGRLEKLRLELTTICNLRCVYCPVNQPNYVKREMPAKALEPLVNLVKNQSKIKEILVNGHGETTFFPGWRDFCGALGQFGRRLSVISNLARPLSIEDARCLARFWVIQVSLDTVNTRLLAQIRRHVKLGTIVHNITMIREQALALGLKGPNFALSCGVFDKSAPGLVDVANFAVSHRFISVTFWQLVKYPDVSGAIAVTRIPDLPVVQIRKSIEFFENALRILDRACIKAEIAGDFLNEWRSICATKEAEKIL